MQQDDQDIQNENLVNDDVASQLIGSPMPSMPAPVQQPGQQYTPDPMSAPAMDDDMNSGMGDLSATSAEPSQTEDEAPMTFTPPTQPEPANDAPTVPSEEFSAPADVETQVAQAVDAIGEPDTTDESPVSRFSVEPESVEDEPVIEPEENVVTPVPVASPTPIGDDPTDDTDEEEPSELVEIKKKALEELKPLVDKIDLTPEKKYDLLMEIIQASDDMSLIQDAYDAAYDIEDDDLRAQALMEIINEIEYLQSNK